MRYKNKLLPILVYSVLCFVISVVSGISNGISFQSILLRGFLFSIVGASAFIIILLTFSRIFAGVNFSTVAPAFGAKISTDLNENVNNNSTSDIVTSSPTAKTNATANIGNNINIVLDNEQNDETQSASETKTTSNSQPFSNSFEAYTEPTMGTNTSAQGTQSLNSANVLGRLISQNESSSDKDSISSDAIYTKTGSNTRKHEKRLLDTKEQDELQNNLQMEIDKTMSEFNKSPEKVKLAVASLIKKGDNSK